MLTKSDRNRAYRIANKDKIRAYSALNRDKHRLYMKQYYIANKECLLLQMRDYYLENQKEKQAYARKQGPIYRKQTPAKQVAKMAKYRAAKLLRTPKWLTKEQFKEIETFYILAKELQWLSNPCDPLEVDHIIPLKGKDISGLHVPWNLQILPKSLNSAKYNKVERAG